MIDIMHAVPTAPAPITAIFIGFSRRLEAFD
jgi:hypothetical protein